MIFENSFSAIVAICMMYLLYLFTNWYYRNIWYPYATVQNLNSTVDSIRYVEFHRQKQNENLERNETRNRKINFEKTLSKNLHLEGVEYQTPQ